MKLGNLECLTVAPEDYDYGWARTVQYNVAVDDRNKVYRLVRNEDKFHFDNQVMRYGSGMNATITDQKDLDNRIRLGFLTLTEKPVPVHYMSFDMEKLNQDDNDPYDDFCKDISGFDEKFFRWRGMHMDVRVVGDELRDEILNVFRKYQLEPINDDQR